VAEKATNLKSAERMIREAAARGANVIMLPEMFVCPYTGKHMLLNAEKVCEADVS
jgi:omega-amidase